MTTAVIPEKIFQGVFLAKDRASYPIVTDSPGNGILEGSQNLFSYCPVALAQLSVRSSLPEHWPIEIRGPPGLCRGALFKHAPSHAGA
jgi:hypothetical protein